MKTAIINAIKMDNFERLSIQDKKRSIDYLIKNGLSFRDITRKTGIPHTTLFGWYKGREVQKEKQIEVRKEIKVKSINIDFLMHHFQKYKPKYEEKEKLKRLAFIILECIK